VDLDLRRRTNPLARRGGAHFKPYRAKKKQTYVKQYSQARIGELPPHIFAIAEATFYNLKKNKENQSVIISGRQLMNTNS